MFTPGTLLRLAREERRLSVSDIRYFVRIRESAIIAMENDAFERFPAEYMQAFLPVYSDFLGVSHYKLAESFKTTLPQHEYLTGSLYARTLQQIATTQLQEEYDALHPAFMKRVSKFAGKHAMKAVVLLVTCVLGWSVGHNGGAALGTALATRFVATPSEMRGTPFTELSGETAQNRLSVEHNAQKRSSNEVVSTNDEMRTVQLSSLMNVDLAAVQTFAVKHGAAVSYAVGDALVHAVDDLSPRDKMSAGYDASRRSVSSIASEMLARIPEEKNTAEQQEIGTISEVSIEQNRFQPSAVANMPNAKAGILVEGVETISIGDVQSAKKRVTMRLIAMKLSLLSPRLRSGVPEISTVELRSNPVHAPLQVAMMNPSASWKDSKAGAAQVLVPVEMPKLPNVPHDIPSTMPHEDSPEQ